MRLAIVLTLLLAGCTKTTASPTRDGRGDGGETTWTGRKIELKELMLWRYDPARDQWVKMPGDVIRAVLFEPTSFSAMTGSATTRPEAAPIGLYWAGWTQDGQDRGALLFRGPVKCNDLKIGDPPAGKVAACVPSEHSAKAQFVPDPRIFCK